MKKSMAVKGMAALVCLAMLAGVQVSGVLAAGTVDWGKGVVSAIAMADPMAQRGSTMGQKVIMARTAALGMAEAYLLGTIKGIEIDRATTIEDAIVAGDLIEKKVKGVIRQAMVVEEGVNELDLYEVRVAVNLAEVAEAVEPAAAAGSGAAGSALMKKLPAFHRSHALTRKHLGISDDRERAAGAEAGSRAAGGAEYVTGEEWADAGPAASSGETVVADSGFTGKSTGSEPERAAGSPRSGASAVLIIDCRGLGGIVRDRAPVVYSESGKEIFKGWEIPYCTTATEASDYFGDDKKPIVIKAIGVWADSASATSPHVMISDEDAEKVLKANREYGFIEGGLVVIVLS